MHWSDSRHRYTELAPGHFKNLWRCQADAKLIESAAE
jgi:hypothetical protein